MKKIVINGQFLARRMTGQERFAYEIVLELDKLVEKNHIELIVPRNAVNIPKLDNIKIIKFGILKGVLWEQLELGYYVIKNKFLCLNLCTIAPLFTPGIVCIHDISYKINPKYFKTLYLILSKWWHRLNYWVTLRKGLLIYTVSEYSKKQMINVYNVKPEKIKVIFNGWQHFNRVLEDNSVFDKWPELRKNNYFFSLGSLAPNKNIKWILTAAKNNPNYNFVIAGMSNSKIYGEDYTHTGLKNVIFLGFISDGSVKSLMNNCKAFIFPSEFEGFGIPPLEAMSVGAKIIVSRSSCLPEIYEDCAYYIDPNNPYVDIGKLLKAKIGDSNKVLNKYSFANSAKIIWSNIKEILHTN
ncbi:glycosyltransferase family 4 protein [Clostridium botulinum]|uniref:glycosyltransferase family 4 protein n=1 Tax=Clostridium botulinum TaxID=1491 RepID=UPI000773A51E|nr:glycosyltransferase family 1 protein [Clostridium botulinum]NFE95391.1 glycosyltransferase family 4 protein [Clostridium botulinum]NFL38232.1 glycosyltransferase family 4 protein [Clostridium botulinum]NFL64711.1 glycosyltransferase family 4 protein [Clostridium botulinum]NFN08041.1 glycosyltransferase family 4 protein [Clostridium botulinum]NFN24240.1 glycosyltransferase family 4 protein [Clostridium botulinum]